MVALIWLRMLGLGMIMRRGCRSNANAANIYIYIDALTSIQALLTLAYLSTSKECDTYILDPDCKDCCVRKALSLDDVPGLLLVSFIVTPRRVSPAIV